MPPRIEVVEAGTHKLGDPGNTAEYIGVLLQKAGYTGDYDWKAQLDKKLHSAHDSLPIRVKGYRAWVVYLRVKATINGTYDHQVSLFVPDGSGYRAENLHNQLLGAEKGANRAIRTGEYRKRPTAAPVLEGVGTGASGTADPNTFPQSKEEPLPEVTKSETKVEVPVFENLRGVATTDEKLVFVLSKIREAGSNFFNMDAFKVHIVKVCGWESQADNAISRVFHTLEKFGYIELVVGDRQKKLYYQLTADGLKQLPPTDKISAPQAPPKDYGQLLMSVAPHIKGIAEIATACVKNRQQREDLEGKRIALDKEIANLDNQYTEMASVLSNNPEMSGLLERLVVVYRPLPMKGDT